MTKHAITWFEIPAIDFDRAVNFYSALLRQPLRRGEFGGMPHGFFPADEQGVAGAVVLNPNYRPSDSGPVIYLNAGNDLDSVLARLEAAGGTVTLPKTDISPQGHIAMVIDSEGNQIALHQPPM